MCTLTWLTNDHGYEVFFNRDEQRNRAPAIPPLLDNESDSIMPIDPQGKGTWIAVNSSGITLCLLNNYQAAKKMIKTDQTSRGLLIPSLIKNKSYSEILRHLHDINLGNYMPFMLCIFPENLNNDNKKIHFYQWDGNRLTKEQNDQPITSSAVSLKEVEKSRTNLFMASVGDQSDSEKHLIYHASHKPEKGKYSVCMHRQDAHTQSLSHITVGHDIEFRYHGESPCQHTQWSQVIISCNNAISNCNN